MATRTIPFYTYANTAITMDVPDDIADDPEAVALYMQENGDFPRLNISNHNLDLGDEWQSAVFEGKIDMYKD